MNEYIIINKTAIQKRIEELKYQRELAGNLFEDREYNLNHISMELPPMFVSLSAEQYYEETYAK